MLASWNGKKSDLHVGVTPPHFECEILIKYGGTPSLVGNNHFISFQCCLCQFWQELA